MRRKCIRKTPDRSPPEFLVLRFEVEVLNRAGEVLRRFQFAFKRLVDDDFRRDIRQLALLPGLHLLSHELEVPPTFDISKTHFALLAVSECGSLSGWPTSQDLAVRWGGWA